jgi:hypothetical protein
MVDSDKSNFVTQLTHFSVVHKQPFTDSLRNAYWEDLKEMTRAEFDSACTYLRKHSKWFPKPEAFFAARRQGWM